MSNGTYNLTLGAGNANGSFAGIIHGNNSTGGTTQRRHVRGRLFVLTKIGTGTQILSGSNTYSAGTTVSGGTLRGSQQQCPGRRFGNDEPVGRRPPWTSPSRPRLASLGSSGAGTSTILLGNAAGSGTATTLTINNPAATTFGGSIGDMTPSAAGAVGNLVHSGQRHADPFRHQFLHGQHPINAGTLLFTSSSALPTPQNNMITIAGGYLGAAGPYTSVNSWLNSGLIAASPTSGGIALTTLLSEPINLATAGTGSYAGTYGNLFLGSIGTNTYSGSLTPAGTTYRLGGGGGTLVLPGNSALTDNGSTPQALVVNGNVTLTGSNTYSGGTTINAGTLLLSGGNNSLSSSGNITVASGVLDLGGNGQTTSGTVSLQGGTVQNGTLTNNSFNYTAQSGVINATLAGSVGLTKSGAGTLTISASSTYSGPTVINGGTLKLTGGVTSLQVTSGLSYWLNATSGTIASLANNAAVTSWVDSTSNGVNFNGTATYATNAINGLSAVSFNGTSNKLTAAISSSGRDGVHRQRSGLQGFGLLCVGTKRWRSLHPHRQQRLEWLAQFEQQQR